MAIRGKDLFRVTREEFLAGEVRASQRSEWVDGVIYAQAGAVKAHGLAVTRIMRLLADHAAEQGCQLISSDLLVETATGAIYYPDVVLACEPSDDERVEHRPCFIAEVLSPSTSRTDRHEKRDAYCATPTMRDYWIVDVDNKVVEAWTRTDRGRVGSHRTASDVITVQCLSLQVAAAELFAR